MFLQYLANMNVNMNPRDFVFSLMLYTMTEKTIFGVHVSPGSAETRDII